MIYESHEYANLFPMMLDNEYQELKNDIKANGLLEPIWLFEGKILDGRNRYSACLDTGTKPQFKDYQGTDPLGFVVSLNLNRRHLTSGQKATLAVELLPLLEAEAKKRMLATQNNNAAKEISASQKFEQQVSEIEQSILQPEPKESPIIEKIKANTAAINEKKSTEKAATLTGSNRQYVSDAKKIKEVAPEVFEQVKAGTLTMQNAKKEVKEIVQAKESQTETWEFSQLTRKNECLSGLTVVANQKTDNQLIGWAREQNKLVKCDRTTDWGNPFEIGRDGNRDDVIHKYHAYYFPHKDALNKELPLLKGKVLLCWCFPEKCHCDKLAEMANKV